MNKPCKGCSKIIDAKSGHKYCVDCKYLIKDNKKLSDKKYKENNKALIDERNKKYREDNRDIIRKKDRDYYAANSEKRKNSSINSPNYKLNKRKYQKRKRENPIFKLHQAISFAVNKAIKRNGSTKGGSILGALPYSFDELKIHIQNQFESWMSWDNWGVYNKKTWDDNDQSTWTWNIDHIIPKSKFYYSSMKDVAFNACWALSNLRPYSAKLNIMEQNKR